MYPWLVETGMKCHNVPQNKMVRQGHLVEVPPPPSPETITWLTNTTHVANGQLVKGAVMLVFCTGRCLPSRQSRLRRRAQLQTAAEPSRVMLAGRVPLSHLFCQHKLRASAPCPSVNIQRTMHDVSSPMHCQSLYDDAAGAGQRRWCFSSFNQQHWRAEMQDLMGLNCACVATRHHIVRMHCLLWQ